ncbi:MAG: hypothetical protein P0Y55_06740 [Candidatus Cohnella colombiensis]|uniref:DUF5590 domain-containing protein n=1 Tax=Candidatus Cohnella colombiensis TaxID=3121368 RepID=A0AA95F143_9BACL|nr:MAG: hypothetical protein P0Y55_06740 [Cohnella sp.]
MNLSRSESFRRIPSISLRRWIIIIVGFIVFVGVSFVLYIRSADSVHRQEEKHAIRIAEQQAAFAEVKDATVHIWEEKMWIVRGLDAEGVEWMLWERQDELVKLKVSDNFSERQMLDKFVQEHSGKEPIQLIPGWFQDQPVWEVRYWNEVGERHQAIDFYSFKDGTKLKTYELAIQ